MQRVSLSWFTTFSCQCSSRTNCYSIFSRTRSLLWRQSSSKVLPQRFDHYMSGAFLLSKLWKLKRYNQINYFIIINKLSVFSRYSKLVYTYYDVDISTNGLLDFSSCPILLPMQLVLHEISLFLIPLEGKRFSAKSTRRPSMLLITFGWKKSIIQKMITLTKIIFIIFRELVSAFSSGTTPLAQTIVVEIASHRELIKRSSDIFVFLLKKNILTEEAIDTYIIFFFFWSVYFLYFLISKQVMAIASTTSIKRSTR